MQENFKDSFALGIIDKDKREITYIKEFELLASKDSLYLYKHQTKHHYIIQISPAMEKFFMKAADEKGINIANYELPTDLKGLTKVTKQISGQNEAAFKKFKRLFKDLVDASEVATLAGLIKYIGENMYNVDVEEVKGLLG